MHRLQQHPIRVAMHDAVHRAMGMVADRIGPLFRRGQQFGRIGHELPGNRIGNGTWLDQPGDVWRDRHGIPRCDGLDPRLLAWIDKACGLQFIRSGDGAGETHGP